MKVCLDLHDFSVVNSRLDLLLKLKDHFPTFKVSLFTVPVDRADTWGIYTIRGEILNKIKENLDWIQIIPHGYDHKRSEVRDCGYDQFRLLLKYIEESFEKDGLPFEKGFCAPHWRWNEDVVRVLDEDGWWGAVDPRQPNMPTTKIFYRYSYTIDNIPLITLNYRRLKLHGHIYGTKNDLGRCMDNLLKFPSDTEWCFVTEFLEENNEN